MMDDDEYENERGLVGCKLTRTLNELFFLSGFNQIKKKELHKSIVTVCAFMRTLQFGLLTQISQVSHPPQLLLQPLGRRCC